MIEIAELERILPQIRFEKRDRSRQTVTQQYTCRRVRQAEVSLAFLNDVISEKGQGEDRTDRQRHGNGKALAAEPGGNHDATTLTPGTRPHLSKLVKNCGLI